MNGIHILIQLILTGISSDYSFAVEEQENHAGGLTGGNTEGNGEGRKNGVSATKAEAGQSISITSTPLSDAVKLASESIPSLW